MSENNLSCILLNKEKNYIKKKINFNILNPPLDIYNFINIYDLNYLYGNFFNELWIALNNNNLLILNNNVLNFILNNCEKFLHKKEKLFKFFKTHKIELNKKQNVFYIKIKDLKLYFCLKKKNYFEKIYYIILIENLFKNYKKYLMDRIIYTDEEMFLNKQNLLKINNYIFYNYWNAVKYNCDVVITYHTLEFLGFDLPHIPKKFRKSENEIKFINFLKCKKIFFEEIAFNDSRCYYNDNVINFIKRNNDNKRILKKKWILLSLNNFKTLLHILNSPNKNKIIKFFDNIENLYKVYLNTKHI